MNTHTNTQNTQLEQTPQTVYLPNEIWDMIMRHLNIEKQLENLGKISNILDLKEKCLEQQHHNILERTIELNEKEFELNQRSIRLNAIGDRLDQHLFSISKILNDLIDEDKSLK